MDPTIFETKKNIIIKSQAVFIHSLFLPTKSDPKTTDPKNNKIIYQLSNPIFEYCLHKQIFHVYETTKKRLAEVSILDDEFHYKEKSLRTEQNRTVYRSIFGYSFGATEKVFTDKNNIGSKSTNMESKSIKRKAPLDTSLELGKLFHSIYQNANHSNKIDTEKLFNVSITSIHDKDEENFTFTIKDPVSPFPGSLPQSILKSDIPTIYNAHCFYTIAPKTNGIRFLLVACSFFNQKMLLLVDRAQHVYLLKCKCPDIIFDGTILDGELVLLEKGPHKNEYCFLVYDSIMVCGVPCSEYNYLIRKLNALTLLESWEHSLLDSLGQTLNNPTNENIWLHHSLDSSKRIFLETSCEENSLRHVSTSPIIFRIKHVYEMNQIYEMLTKVIPSLDHEIDGLILTAVEPCVQMFKTNTIFKWKKGNDHTIDFLCNIIQPGVVDLMCFCNETKLWYVWTQILTKTTPEMQHSVVECRYLYDTKDRIVKTSPHESSGWIIETVRNDKNQPNLKSTVEKTWQNIEENLSLLDLFPKGSLPEETRNQIKNWELEHQHLSWHSFLKYFEKMDNKSYVVPLAPVNILQMSKY